MPANVLVRPTKLGMFSIPKPISAIVLIYGFGLGLTEGLTLHCIPDAFLLLNILNITQIKFQEFGSFSALVVCIALEFWTFT